MSRALLLLALFAPGVAFAAPHPYFVGVSLGLTSFYGTPDSGGGIGFARATAHLPWLSIDAYGGEGLSANDTRLVGAIGIGLRRYFGPVHLRVGFAHHHETPWDEFVANIGGSLAGTGTGIRHRSGVEAGAGYTWTFPFWKERLGIMTNLDVRWFPDAFTAPLYVTGGVEVEVRLGKPKAEG